MFIAAEELPPYTPPVTSRAHAATAQDENPVRAVLRSERGWRSIVTVPRDGRELRLLLSNGWRVRASWPVGAAGKRVNWNVNVPGLDVPARCTYPSGSLKDNPIQALYWAPLPPENAHDNASKPIIIALARLYGRDVALQWLRSEQFLLGGQVPNDLIRRGDSDVVLEVVQSLVDADFGDEAL